MKTIYGIPPKELQSFIVEPKEMMFYQYLPIKMIGSTQLTIEKRLNCFEEIIGACVCNFIKEYGTDAYLNSYVYLTAKNLYQAKDKKFNRTGYHSDGFLTDDINYIWSDQSPTIFNISEFNLTLDDQRSLQEMEKQALPENEICYNNNALLRLNQFNIHKVNELDDYEGMRAFIKVSFSKDKYNLIGNSRNYELDYNWSLKPRNVNRNIPQANLHETS